MKEQAYEQLTLFQEDSHVNHFPLPGSEEARKMTVTSGQRCAELLKNSSPIGSLARMCLESSIWHSTRCYLSWKTSATPHKRLLFRLVVRMLRIEETGSLFWPTPKASGLGGCSGARKTLQAMANKGLITEEERRAMSAGNSSRTNPQLFEWLMGYEQKFTELIPTPRASDYKGAASIRFYTHTHTHTRRVPKPALRAAGSHSAWDNWPVESDIPRVADGIPNRVDRIRCLGNAVVPQQAFPFFYYIMEVERRLNDTNT